ncbi:putative enolase-phosphatase E1-like [Apostichopus japonicus]|uniref:Putative enolase-phosphatase E1-like n=1 Tax=Stichopus japonicus TaxID=307972 RepID=A0A2G8L674_STIJA|nr:putative enolase-phosphatase E1-like [Apostichopus japonicus]
MQYSLHHLHDEHLATPMNAIPQDQLPMNKMFPNINLRILSPHERSLLDEVSNEDLAKVKTLVLEENVNINIRDSLERSPLMRVSFVDDRTARDGMTELFIQNGADVNMVDLHGCSALMLACREEGKEDMVKLLMECSRTDPNLQDEDGNTALVQAIEIENVPVVRTLLTVSVPPSPQIPVEAGKEQEETGKEQVKSDIVDKKDAEGVLTQSNGDKATQNVNSETLNDVKAEDRGPNGDTGAKSVAANKAPATPESEKPEEGHDIDNKSNDKIETRRGSTDKNEGRESISEEKNIKKEGKDSRSQEVGDQVKQEAVNTNPISDGETQGEKSSNTTISESNESVPRKNEEEQGYDKAQEKVKEAEYKKENEKELTVNDGETGGDNQVLAKEMISTTNSKEDAKSRRNSKDSKSIRRHSKDKVSEESSEHLSTDESKRDDEKRPDRRERKRSTPSKTPPPKKEEELEEREFRKERSSPSKYSDTEAVSVSTVTKKTTSSKSTKESDAVEENETTPQKGREKETGDGSGVATDKRPSSNSAASFISEPPQSVERSPAKPRGWTAPTAVPQSVNKWKKRTMDGRGSKSRRKRPLRVEDQTPYVTKSGRVIHPNSVHDTKYDDIQETRAISRMSRMDMTSQILRNGDERRRSQSQSTQPNNSRRLSRSSKNTVI